MERPLSRSGLATQGGMARPSSRGGPPGGGGVGAPPPGTGYRGVMPQSRGGPRPGSGMRTGARPGTGVNTDVQVADRPVTQQGMTGMRTAAQGPGRQVQDKSYFLTELRHKKQELSKVLESMNFEIDKMSSDAKLHAQLDRKHGTLSTEVRALQGELADYNIILDKVGTATPPEEIQQQYMMLKQHNDGERKKVDAVFTERSTWEQRTKDVDHQVLNYQRGLEEKLNELPPAKREQYFELQGENDELLKTIEGLERELEDLAHTANSMEVELASNNIKQRALSLSEQIRGLQDRKFELEAEESKLSLSPEEQREQMKLRIRADNEEIAAAEQQIKMLQEQIRKHEARNGAGVKVELPDAGGGVDTQEKYEQLLRQEQELGDFLDHYDSNKYKVHSEISQRKETITALLERISKGLTLQGNLPSQRRFREMQDELEYKKVQMENAQTTQTRLQQELDLRKSELEKINTLEDKIKLELSSLNTKIETMQEELVTFTRLDLLKEQSIDKKHKLEAARVRLSRTRDSTRQQVAEKSQMYKTRRNQLQENELYIALEKLEVKMRSLEQNIFTMQDYVKAKEAENNYKPQLDEVADICEVLNQECQKAARL
eukprot:CAMPEP_0118951980 /NCGR_PEP_ID=MMETSP1169-20130426/54012_1 /TAXON_ID=36882 /ORGANISM="Pyramimonas obovata, Strain CCMP722" /LENGTH=604 /DNA_ID=CAMNT_0006899135 /DNA_START=101 /DNA_END=1915 /DNA_ORIENTATION=+